MPRTKPAVKTATQPATKPAPAASPSPSLRAALAHAAELAAAGDARGAVSALLVAWREVPAPEIADAIDRVTSAALASSSPTSASSSYEDAVASGDVLEPARLVDRLREVNAAAAVPRAAALLRALEPDPRVSAAIVRLLEDPPFHATGSRPFWTVVFELLERHADPRALAPLAALPARYPAIVSGASMRGILVGKIERARAALAARFPKAPSLPDDDARALAAKVALPAGTRTAPVPDPVATRGPGARSAASEADLFRAVYERPDDDAPRVALADWLAERGDPRGEFIHLQLAREGRPLTKEEQSREHAILVKQRSTWLGAAATAVKYKNSTLLGAPSPWGFPVHTRWRRGFLAGACLAFTSRSLAKLGAWPGWATLDEVSHLRGIARGDAAQVARAAAFLRGLRGVRRFSLAGVDELRAVVATPELAARVEHFDLWDVATDLDEHLRMFAAMPRLQRFELRGGAGPREGHGRGHVERVLASEAWGRASAARIHAHGGELVIEKVPGGLAVTVVHPTPPSVHELVAALPPRDVARFAVRGYAPDAALVEALARRFPRVEAPEVRDLNARTPSHAAD